MISCANDVTFIIERIMVGIVLLFSGCMLIAKRKILVDALEAPGKALWKKPGSEPFKIEEFVHRRIFFFFGTLFLLCGILVICTELYKIIICFFA